MDALTFISILVQSLAWPFTILILLIVYRRQILSLIPALRAFRYGGFELEFSSVINRLANQADEAGLPQAAAVSRGASVQSVQDLGRLYELNVLSPRAAILEAWLLIEQELRSRAESADLPFKSGHAKLVLDELLNRNRLSGKLYSIIEQLRSLRNEAASQAHFEVSPAVSEGYIELASRVIVALRRS